MDSKTEEGYDHLNFDVDRRGRHRNRPSRVPESIKDTAREHIKSFPTVEMFDENEQVTRKFLDKSLDLSKMFAMYKQSMEERGCKDLVSDDMYRKIFNSEFKYGFCKRKQHK